MITTVFNCAYKLSMSKYTNKIIKNGNADNIKIQTFTFYRLKSETKGEKVVNCTTQPDKTTLALSSVSNSTQAIKSCFQ